MSKGTGLILPGSQLSQDMIDLAQELNDKYPNLSLGWIPPEERGKDESLPFAIIQINSAGEQIAIIKRLSVFEVHGSFIFNWLWENDSTRMDPWTKHLEGIKKAAEEKRAKEKDQNYELAEMVHAVASSNKHTYRINGHKIGAENNFPTLGLNDD